MAGYQDQQFSSWSKYLPRYNEFILVMNDVEEENAVKNEVVPLYAITFSE